MIKVLYWACIAFSVLFAVLMFTTDFETSRTVVGVLWLNSAVAVARAVFED